MILLFQEMVNLYISGRAVSNVFNDVMELDSGEGNIMILKGIVSRCDVGLLSLFEHYKSCQVHIASLIYYLFSMDLGGKCIKVFATLHMILINKCLKF